MNWDRFWRGWSVVFGAYCAAHCASSLRHAEPAYAAIDLLCVLCHVGLFRYWNGKIQREASGT